MEFDFSKDQELIRASVKEFLEKECPSDKVREMDADERGYDPVMWRRMAELGWMSIPFPDEYGGTGGDFMDLMIVIEGLGYYACPGPFFSTLILGGLPILSSGSEDQKKEILPRIADGDMIMTMAFTEIGGSYDASSINAEALPDKGEYVMNGVKLFIPYADISKYLLFAARTEKGSDSEDGITVFLVDAKSPGIKYTPLKTINREKQYEVAFDNVRILENNIVGALNKGWPILKEAMERAAVAQCFEMIGGAMAVKEMALDYAKKRNQFGRPIGSFQAVQQHFANMWMWINTSRHLINKAAWKITNGLPASREAAMAKARTGDIYRKITILAHQVFAAIGFTMEHDMHLYHRRSVAGDIAFGNTDFQKENVARELGL